MGAVGARRGRAGRLPEAARRRRPGGSAAIVRLVAAGADIEARDGHGRTPLMVAAHRRNLAAAQALIAAGADINRFDHDRYDMLTIAAVNADVAMVRLAIASGADPGLVTSPYQGTALIAAAISAMSRWFGR